MIKLLPIKVFTFICTLIFCTTYAQKNPMHPKNEFRAFWIATVANIDWPKNGKDSVDKQKSDFIELLDTYKKLNYNVVIVQIRSVGDAFYCTNLAPWSRYLTGEEGKDPKPYYDPLEWMITQAHKRGFEFHAWLNPFRATNDLRTNLLSPNHDLNKHPDWMIKYGDKFFYNPALPEVQDHLIKVVEEVVQNYDIDAIHFDDYFYPYEIKGQTFNDTDTFTKFGNGLTLEDWRRLNVSKYIKNTSDAIKKIKPWVQFGISPFGVWRNKSEDPKGSETQAGQTNYDHLFADPLEWMQNKSIDYILPQLYWNLDHPLASYSVLAKWWSDNSPNTALYLGNSTYKINNDTDKKWSDPNEIPNQVNLSRTFPKILGHGYFSAKWFMNMNKDVTDILANNQYKYPALPLAVPSLQKQLTSKPQIKSFQKDSLQTEYTLIYPDKIDIRYVIVYQAPTIPAINTEDATQFFDKIYISKKENEFIISLNNNANIYAISYVDFYGNETPATILDNKLFTDKSLKIYPNIPDIVKTNSPAPVTEPVKPIDSKTDIVVKPAEVVKPTEPVKAIEPAKTPVKPVEVAKPTEPAKVVEPAKTPVKPVEVAKPTEPAKVVEPVKTPVKPVEVAKPTEPAKVVEPVKTPVKPAEVAKPTEPAKVVETAKTPVKPAEVAKPTEPAKVVELVKTSVKPAEVAKPTEPAKVVEPAKTPVKPTEVAKPTEPAKVVEPAKTPVKPAEVAKPTEPAKVVESAKTPVKPAEVAKPTEPAKVVDTTKKTDSVKKDQVSTTNTKVTKTETKTTAPVKTKKKK